MGATNQALMGEIKRDRGNVMDLLDQLRHTATELDIADRRFTARADEVTFELTCAERSTVTDSNGNNWQPKNRLTTLMILAIFGLWCLCLGIAVAGMLLRRG